MNEGPSSEPVEVFRSVDVASIRERELVLRALGIPSFRHQDRQGHALFTDGVNAERALRELVHYEEENRDWPPREELPPVGPGALEGTFVALLLLLVAFLLETRAAFGLDWKTLGAAHAEAIRSGELWRALTALFLHTDVVHLVSNLVFGALFGGLVAYGHGGGLGWFAILVAGTVGNLANAFIQDPGHVSIGASTGVFAAVGILAGSEWRRRRFLRQRALRRAAPIVMALTLLAFHGFPAPRIESGELLTDTGRMDVLAHVTGFAAGLFVGVLLPALNARAARSRGRQRAAGLAALLLVLLAWFAALL